MLVPALQHTETLSKLWTQHVTHPHYIYWNVDLNYNPLAEIRNTDYRKDEWVSVVDGRVIGYLCALIDKSTRSVADISVASFEKHPQYGYDFVAFIKYIRRHYRYVRWAAIDGHPNQKAYETILRRYGGRIVGTFKKKIRLHDGRLYDERWYEINNEDRASAT
jgi:hypothetical protein